MKTYIYLISAIFVISCKAQTIPLGEAEWGEQGVYYRDVDNDLNKFVGEWEWTDGSKTLFFKIEKEERYFGQEDQDGITFETDLLIGEYRYEENGQVIVNTLDLFNSPIVSGTYHGIWGVNLIYPTDRPICPDCRPGLSRIICVLADPERRHISNSVRLTYDIVGSQEVLKAYLYKTGNRGENTDPMEIRVPYGEYILVKQ